MQDKSGNYAKVQGSTIGNLYRGVRDNGASVALGTAGAIGGGILGGGVGMVGGGALGSALGAGYDYYGNTKETNQEANAKEALMLMGENAGLSLIGDGAFAGVAKGAKALKGAYNTAQSGARAGKDMIDGVSVNTKNLGNRFIDKLGQKDIPFVGKFTDGGLQNAENIANNLIKDTKDKAKIDELIKKENPIYLQNSKPIINTLKEMAEYGLNKNNPLSIQAGAKKSSELLEKLGNTLQSYPTTQRREVLLKMAQAYPELKSFLVDVLASDKDISVKFLNLMQEQGNIFKNKIGIDTEFDFKAWQKDNKAYQARINDEYAGAIKKLDELNNGKIVLNNADLKKLEDFKNNNFLGQDIKRNIESYLDEIKDKELSAEQIFSLRTAINNELVTGNKSYNTKGAYKLIKDTLDEALIRNAKDKELARDILKNANENFALKENFKESYLGKLKAQETPEELINRVAKGLRNTNEDKNLTHSFKGMNEKERLKNETHAFNALLSKYKIDENLYDFKGMAKDLENVDFKSKQMQNVKEVINSYALIYANNKEAIETALKSSGKKTNSSMATTIKGVFDRILISGIVARIHALVPFVKSAKEQALRNQILDAIKLAKTHKDVIKNLKNIKINDEKLSKIFKDNLNNFIKVDKTENEKLKEALQKEGLIKGDSFFMDKPDPKYAKSDLNVKISISPNVRDLAKLTNDEIIADLEYLANKHKEMFKKPSDVFKLIKEIKENPTFFYKNNRIDVSLIAKRLNGNKLGKLGINKDTGEVRHITNSRNADKENERIMKRDGKSPLVESPYSTQPVLSKDAEPTANGANALSKGNNPNSTQNKPKTNLMDELKENIKAKEIKKKNKKSVKERLDEYIKQKEEDKIIHSNSFTKGKTLPLNPKDNSSIKESNNNELYTKDKKAKMPFDNDEKIKKLSYDEKQKYLNELSEIFNNKHKNLFDTLSKATNNKEFAKALQENEEKITDYLFDWIVSTQKYLDGAGYADFSKALMSNDSSLVRALESLRHLKDGTKAFIYNNGKNLKGKNPPKKAFYFSFLKKDDISGFYSLNQNLRQSLIKKLENYIKTNVKNPPSWINDLLNKKYEVKKYKSIDELFFG